MRIRVRFFARFRELLGTDIEPGIPEGTTFQDAIKAVTVQSREGHDAIFDECGAFREFVILMRNGKRVEHADAASVVLKDGDEIAVFPPVAGG